MTLSPFHAILHTNTVPSDPDCAQIRAFLKEPQQEAMELENTATSLRKQLEVTEQRLEEVKLLISAREALISPMRRVPVDVLRTIFLHTLPTARTTAMSPIEGPLLLCEVCKDWCDIALSTPRLWASIHVVVTCSSWPRCVPY
ncbi:hypothetical protein C8F01DRAFT_990780 [Mycena amicta]|nr:hypothetical protein C8F01DRAFT_990780 [Mycena amicta]